MQVTLGVGVTRRGVDETITGLWTFANVLGLLTDILGERTAATGVTVDGLLIKDAGIPEAAVTAHEAALAILESQVVDGTILARLAANENVTGDWLFVERIVGGDGISFDTLPLTTTFAYLARVIGDGFARFSVQADGDMAWGDGTGARDTNLFRDGANILRTDDTLRVGSNLEPLAGLFLSEVTPGSFAANKNNFATGTAIVQRLENTSGSARSISGFAGGSAGRVICVTVVPASAQINLLHEDAGSIAANRMSLRGSTAFSLLDHKALMLWYDNAISRWIPLADSDA